VSDVDSQPEAPTAPSLRPGLRQRIGIRAATWQTSLPSIVEDVLDEDLVVGAPITLAEGMEPAQGDTITVAWEDANGPHLLDATLVTVLRRELPQWQLRPHGVPRIEQQRRHVRVAMDKPAVLVRDKQSLDAGLIDLSEGGARARLHDPEAVVGVGDVLSLIVVLDGAELDLRARIVRVHVLPGQPRTVTATFQDLTHHQADVLRRHVFAEQTRARQRTLR
jgi:hypothetical protein